jgi:hypothetical protein
VRGQHDARRYAAVIATMLQALAADPGALPMSVCEA